MIKNTTNARDGILSAYQDNAAVLAGTRGGRFYPDRNRIYGAHPENITCLIKCETHNHPTAISPFPGAATGAGGEIRDEGRHRARRQPEGWADRVLGIQPSCRGHAALGKAKTASPGRIVSRACRS